MRAEAISANAEVEAFLTEAQLSVADLANSRSLKLLGIRDGGRLVGVVGVEVYGSVGLLRSLAVEPNRRHSGLGGSLVSNAEAWAAKQGVKTLYLLTTTAAPFFAGRGYEAVPRTEAPAAIAATAQFSDLCPASSTFMRKVLAANHSLLARRP
ncbi:MAG: arsenic resistance N-acetyltransferase ArsN2 [Porticoccaceae bacterium]